MNLRTRSIRTGAAGLLLGAAALVGVSLGAAPTAQAASCAGDTGVTVVVDYGVLGGGVTAGCAPSGGGERGSTVFPQAGYPLTWATRDSGFVCRVSGVPADDPCVEASQANAYWSLWWADGKGGGWVYSSRGAGSLRAPEGGYIAFKYHTGGGQATPPAAAATVRTPVAAATPTTVRPTPKPSSGKPSATARPGSAQTTRPANPKPGKTQPATSQPPVQQTEFATGAPTSTSSSTASTTATPTASATSSSSPTTTTSGTAEPSTASTSAASAVPAGDAITAGPRDVVDSGASTDGGLPVWVPVLVVVALLGAAGVVAARRRAH